MDDPQLTDIRQAWHWVGPLLRELIESDPDIEALPEDVYAECKKDLAHLWTSDTGFLITQMSRDRFSSRLKLFVWFAAVTDKRNGNITKYLPFIERLAAHNGCQVIEFGTKHEWMADKVCELSGFRRASITLRKEIEVTRA